MKIESTRQEEIVAVDSNLGAVVGAEKRCDFFDCSNEWKNYPGMGDCQRRLACFLGVLLVLRRLDPEE